MMVVIFQQLKRSCQLELSDKAAACCSIVYSFAPFPTLSLYAHNSASALEESTKHVPR